MKCLYVEVYPALYRIIDIRQGPNKYVEKCLARKVGMVLKVTYRYVFIHFWNSIGINTQYPVLVPLLYFIDKRFYIFFLNISRDHKN